MPGETLPPDLIAAVYRKDRVRLGAATPEELAATDADGRTALMHAVLAEDPDPDLIRLLLRLGAAPWAVDGGQHWTALHFAARDQNRGVVQVLLEGGAPVDATDVFGNTPLLHAIGPSSDPDLIALLLLHGADPGRENRYGVSALALAKQMGRDDLAELMAQGHTPAKP
jgi:ankyrin repeat protein